MDLKTKDLLYILPLADDLREHFLSIYDTLPPGKKYELVEYLWEAYEALHALNLEKNTQLALEQAKTGQEPLNSEFYQKILDKTDEEMNSVLRKDLDEAKLEEARKAMELVVREIQAAKKH